MPNIYDFNLSPLAIPERFHNITYKEDHCPGANKKFEDGANCQFFAYEFLRHYGHFIPDYRSSELWDDNEHTKIVTNLETLDIVLFNNQENAWGAHVGVHLGKNQILHLSKANGLPAIEDLKYLLENPKYKYFIGAKRCISIRPRTSE